MSRRAAVAVAVLAVGWLAASGVLFLWPQQDRSGATDAVVVLAGDPPRRVAKGLELVHERLSKVLVVSDGRRVAPSLCRQRDVLCFRPDPYSTTGEAEAVARLARQHGWKSITVVTSRYHVFRARLLFERCVNEELRVVDAGQPVARLPQVLPLETAKLVWAVAIDRGCRPESVARGRGSNLAWCPLTLPSVPTGTSRWWWSRTGRRASCGSASSRSSTTGPNACAR